MLPDLPALLRPDVRRAHRQGARARVRAGVQRLDGRRVGRRLRRPARSRCASCRCGTRSSRPHEVRRNAGRGVHAVAFSELPGKLGLPTIHDAATLGAVLRRVRRDGHRRSSCTSARARTGSRRRPTRRRRSPRTLVFLTSAMALTDWLFSGVLARYPNLRVCFAEGQIGWIPYVLERADDVWAKDGVGRVPTARCPSRRATTCARSTAASSTTAHGLELARRHRRRPASRSRPTTRTRTRRGRTRSTPSTRSPMLDDDELRKVLRRQRERRCSSSTADRSRQAR